MLGLGPWIFGLRTRLIQASAQMGATDFGFVVVYSHGVSINGSYQINLTSCACDSCELNCVAASYVLFEQRDEDDGIFTAL